MPDLPHGWRMRNNNVDLRGPPVEEDDRAFHSNDEDSENDVPLLDIQPDSDGWEDVDDDTEAITVKCLLCDDTFAAVKVMIAHCTEAHQLDLRQVQQDHKLDFYATMKLVNYIRSEVAAGHEKPVVSDPTSWSDDKFLQPTLQDDPLLFELDEVDGIVFPPEDDSASTAPA